MVGSRVFFTLSQSFFWRTLLLTLATITGGLTGDRVHDLFFLGVHGWVVQLGYYGPHKVPVHVKAM